MAFSSFYKRSSRKKASKALAGQTINGDLTITGDFKVEGGGSFAYDEIIEGTVNVTGLFTITNGAAGLKFVNTGNLTAFHVPSANDYQIGTLTDDKMSFWTNNTHTMSLTNDQLVGIGTTSPSEKLHVSEGEIKIEHTTTGRMNIQGGTRADIIMKDTGAGSNTKFVQLLNEADAFKIRSLTDAGDAGTERMHFDLTNNRIGIGTTSPDGTAHIHSATAGSVSAHPSADDLVVENNGNVGINLLSPNDAESAIYFGDVDDNDVGRLRYSHSDNSMDFKVNTNIIFKIDNNSKISLANNDGGTGNTIFGRGTGGTVASGSNYNVLMGWDVANQGLNGGDFNVSIGTNSSRSLTSGSYNVAVGSNAHYSITTGHSNTAIGNSALYYNETGNYNVAVGRDSQGGADGNSHSNNTSVGYESLKAITTGSSNSSLGYKSGNAITTGGHNTIMGVEAMKLGTNNGYSTALGYRASYSESGSNLMNVSVGSTALFFNTSGNLNTAIGTSAMYGADGSSTGNSNTAVGFESSKGLTTGSNNVSAGSRSLYVITSGSQNTAIGKESMVTHTEGSNNVGIGYQSLMKQTTAGNNVGVGVNTMLFNVTGQQNTAVGANAMQGASGQSYGSNTAIGYGSLFAITTGGSNTAIGHNSSTANTTASNSVSIGLSALASQTTGGNAYNLAVGNYAMQYLTLGVGSNGSNTAIGHLSMRGSSGNSDQAQFNTAVGRDSLSAITGGGHNVAVGVYAGKSITTGSLNVLLGKEAGEAMTTGDECILVGYQAGHLLNHDDADGSVMIGYQAGKDLTSAIGTIIGYLAGAEADDATTKAVYNTYVGYESGRFLDDGTNNTSLGHQAMRSADADGQNAAHNTAIGYHSLYSITDGDYNTAIGTSAGNTMTTSSNTVLIGRKAGYAINSDDANGTVAIGFESLMDLTDGQYNTALGMSSAYNISTGNQNTALGYQTLYQATGTDDTTCVGYQSGYYATGSYNTYIGNKAGRSASGANGSWNVAVGDNALVAQTTGKKNIAIGYQSGNLITTGEQNTIIGYDSDVDANDRDGCIVIGSGLSLNTASDNVVEIGNNTNSMTYDLDGGDITVTSDVRTKKDIKDTKLGLEFINKLRPITYKTKPSSEYPKEFGVKEPSKKSSGKTWDGLIAQEVKEVIDEMDVEFSGWEEGVNTKQRLAYGKFVMPLIKAVQELSARIKELEGK